MGRLRGLSPSELDDRQQAVYAHIAGGRRAEGPQHFRLREHDGSLTGPFNALLYAPELGEALQQVGEKLRYGGAVPPNVREAVILAVARHWSSDFEWYAHAAVARHVGVPEALIRELHSGNTPDVEDPRISAALGLAGRILRREDVPEGEYVSLVELFGEAGVVELSILVGYYQLLAGLLLTFRIGCPEGEEGPFVSVPARGRHQQ